MLVRIAFGFVALVGLAGAVGCGGSDEISPRAACEDAQANMCERIYTCYTPGELATLGFPANEAACVTRLQEAEGCARQTIENTCVGNAKYNAKNANSCVDQISGLDCSQVRDPNMVLTNVAPACGKVCVIP